MYTSETRLDAVEEVVLCEKGRYLVEHLVEQLVARSSVLAMKRRRETSLLFSKIDGLRVGFLSSGVKRA